MKKEFNIGDEAVLFSLSDKYEKDWDEVKIYIGQKVKIINCFLLSNIMTVETKDESWFDVTKENLNPKT